jgi:hypothetical protein
MKTNTNLRTVDNNASSSTAFTIQASGKMFHMVISGLYSNKPQSITREIWSNAFDAHAMVGKETVPFEVTFPTAITPTFSVRDFGPGIAHENMEGFYTVLGHSTKENTNKAVGKWGVGRMSPMSYTDTFSVVSRHNGMIAYYTIQLGPDGSPQLHVLAPPSPTNEESGLEVSFPVKRDDIRQFQEAAEIVAYGFPVPPRVTNSKEKQFTSVTKVFEGDGFYIYNDSRLRGAYAQMGCVMYPIPLYHMDRNLSVVVQFDIGDLEVTASREALSFGPNDPTAENIKKRLAEVYANLHKKMQDQVDAQPTLFKAARLAPQLRNHMTSKDPMFTYKGKELPKFWDCHCYDITGFYAGYRSYGGKTVGWGNDRQVLVKEDYTIFIQDTSDKKANARAATRIAANLKAYSYYIWVRTDLSDMKQKAEVERMLKDFDYPVHYVKDLSDAGPSTGTRTKVSVSYIKDGYRTAYAMDDAEFQRGGYYYPMSNNDYPRHLNNLTGFATSTLNIPCILLVPKTLWKKFEANTQWKLIEPALDVLLKANEKAARAIYGARYDKYPFNDLKHYASMSGPIGDFAKKTMTTYPDKFLGLTGDSWDVQLVRLNLGGFTNSQPRAEHKMLLDKYPLLKLDRQSKEMKQAFVDYITLIDNASKE